MATSDDGGGARSVVIGIIALGVVCVLVALLGWGVISLVANLDSIVAAAVVTASATVLISVFGVIWSNRQEHRRTIIHANREHKLPVYEGLIRIWFQAMNDGLSEEETKAFVHDFSQKMVLWSSSEVLVAYNGFRARVTAANETAESADAMWAFEDLLYAIRRDLGHSNKDLDRGALLRLFVNDVDDQLAREARASTDVAPDLKAF